MLNRAKDYDKNNKERLKEKARDKYRSLSEEEKKRKENNMGRIGIAICLKKSCKKKEKYSKENAAEYYCTNKETIKEK